LYDVVDRHSNRLNSIIAKLQALPLPPSRDPTPVPRAPQSPQTQRSRTGRKQDGSPTPRITLRLDGARAGEKRRRHRKITIPGSVLPPPNPDSPPLSTDSDWDSEPDSPLPVPTSRVGGGAGVKMSSSSRKVGRIKLPKMPKQPKEKLSRKGRPAGALGTNAHSSVAGISSSNALALLKPPPADAVPGSDDAPFLRLTPWELAKLRKRMKKNAVWQPSDTMIARELKNLGRGVEAYRAYLETKKDSGDADNNGEPSADAELAEGEIRPDAVGLEEVQLSNRGMKLNQAKKLKKEQQARFAAEEAAQQAEEAAKRLAEAGRGFRGLFGLSNDGESSATPLVSPLIVDEKKELSKSSPSKGSAEKANAKKRKRDTPAPTSTTTTTTVPLADPGVSAASSTLTSGVPATPDKPHQRASRSSVAPATIAHPPTRPGSRGTATPAPELNMRPRRASTASTAVAAPPPTRAAKKGRKLPAPGSVQVSDAGNTISVGKRKAAPRKKGVTKKDEAQADIVDEDDMEEDPNEPRYCLCNRVSFGVMIECENTDASRNSPPSNAKARINIKSAAPSNGGGRGSLESKAANVAEAEMIHTSPLSSPLSSALSSPLSSPEAVKACSTIAKSAATAQESIPRATRSQAKQRGFNPKHGLMDPPPVPSRALSLRTPVQDKGEAENAVEGSLSGLKYVFAISPPFSLFPDPDLYLYTLLVPSSKCSKANDSSLVRTRMVPPRMCQPQPTSVEEHEMVLS
jgi:hypothetical protein